jgi:hypothetical protein
MVRLARQSLPKHVHKRTQQAKHKKSKAKADRLALKILKEQDKGTVEMGTEEEDTFQTETMTEQEKEQAKLARKKVNAHKNSYKRVIKKTKHFR